MTNLEQTIREHDQRIRMMEDQSLKNTEQMAALLGELHDLSGSLRETVLTFREYAVKHDNLNESNKALWSKYEKQNDAIAQINLTNAKNQEVINSVVSIKNKVMIIVLGAILSPITVGAAIVFTK